MTPLAVVTGGSAGLGAALVDQLERDRGWEVVTVSRSARRAGGIRVDLADAGAVQQALAGELGDALGSARLLVNNAAVVTTAGIDVVSCAELHRQFQLSVASPVLLTQALLRAAKDQARPASVVNVGSIACRRPRAPVGAAYSVGKGALSWATKLLAVAGAPEVTVNIVHPGIMRTGMQADLEGSDAVDAAVASVPLRRLASPTEVAAEILRLGLDSGYLTGEEIAVSGGLGL